MKKLLILAVVMAFSCSVFSIASAGQKYRYDGQPKESTNPEWMTESGPGKVNPRTGEYYAPANPGYVGTRDGTYYAPAGPSGVINTRTGEFIPTD